MSPRVDGRSDAELRPVKITADYSKHAEGSALIECGDTKVICTASVEDKVPSFLRGRGRGCWGRGLGKEAGVEPHGQGS